MPSTNQGITPLSGTELTADVELLSGSSDVGKSKEQAQPPIIYEFWGAICLFGA